MFNPPLTLEELKNLKQMWFENGDSIKVQY
jgi:hypothetical protein